VKRIGRHVFVVGQDALGVPFKDSFFDEGFDEESSDKKEGAEDSGVFEEFGVACRFGGLDDGFSVFFCIVVAVVLEGCGRVLLLSFLFGGSGIVFG